jgi:hypothetical protein
MFWGASMPPRPRYRRDMVTSECRNVHKRLERVAMSRAVSGKRLSRVTEKISFRMVDALFKEVRAEANRLAGQRAAANACPPDPGAL